MKKGSHVVSEPLEKRNSEFECAQILEAVRNADERRRRLVLDEVIA